MADRIACFRQRIGATAATPANGATAVIPSEMQIMRRNGLMLAIALGCVLAWCASASAELGKIIKVEDMPSTLRTAIDSAAPTIKWDMVVRLPEGYKMFGKDSRDHVVLIRVKTAGGIVDVDTKISLAEVPEVVLGVLKTQLPDFEAKAAHALGLDTATALCYKFVGGRANEEILVTADGILAPPDANGLDYIRLERVPSAVSKAAEEFLPKVKWRFAFKDKDGNYMLLGKGFRDCRVQFILGTSPQHEEFRIFRVDIPLSDVRATAVGGLATEMPNFKPYSWQACGMNSTTVGAYRTEGHMADGKRRAVSVSLSGTKVIPD